MCPLRVRASPHLVLTLPFVFQDSFGQGSKTLMFANLSGEMAHIEESVCTLRFAEKVHASHIGPAKKALKVKKKKRSKK